MKLYEYADYLKDKAYIVMCDTLPKDATSASKLETMAKGNEKPMLYVPNLLGKRYLDMYGLANKLKAVPSDVDKIKKRFLDHPSDLTQLTEEFWSDIRKIRKSAETEFKARYERAKKRIEKYDLAHPQPMSEIPKSAQLKLF